jgi:hypothetical protein
VFLQRQGQECKELKTKLISIQEERDALRTQLASLLGEGGGKGGGGKGGKEGEGRLAETRDAGADRWGGGGLVALKDSEVRLLQEQVDKLRRQLLKNYEVTALREEIIAQLQVSFASFVVLFCYFCSSLPRILIEGNHRAAAGNHILKSHYIVPLYIE